MLPKGSFQASASLDSLYLPLLLWGALVCGSMHGGQQATDGWQSHSLPTSALSLNLYILFLGWHPTLPPGNDGREYR